MKREGFADLHQHLLWGLDDGAETPKEMAALLRQSAADGIHLIYATVHADPRRHPIDFPSYRARLAEANAYCAEKGLDICVLPACEIRYRDSVPDQLTDGLLLPLGDSKHVLIEFDPDASMGQIGDAADRLYCAGFQPVLAHVERYRCLVRRPEDTIDFREDYGIRCQMNCATLIQPHGFREHRFVKTLLRECAIDVIATDAHDPNYRPVDMLAAYDIVADSCGEAYAHSVTQFGWDLVKAENATENAGKHAETN